VVPAAALPEVVSGPFDRAVCNAAFWHFAAPGEVLAHLGRLLEPGALLVFNVPAERVIGEPSEPHPFQAALARAIELRTDRVFFSVPTLLDPALLDAWLDEAGFELLPTLRLVCTPRQAELIELMKIPAMIASLAPELSPEARQEVVELAGRRSEPYETVVVPWIYFRARRRGG